MVENEEPFVGIPVFIRGDMNGWDEVNQLSYAGASSYTVEINLTVGDWSTINLGAPTETKVVTLDSPLLLVQDSQDNLSVTIVDDGVYIVTVAGPDPTTPTINISKKL